MALFDFGSPKKRRSKKLKAPKKNASVKQLETYAKKMGEKIEKDQKRKKLLGFVEKAKNYTFS